MCDMCWEEARQAKIGYFDTEVIVKEDVVGFDISMDDVMSMEIDQCTRCLYGNVDSYVPRECALFCSFAMKVISNCSIGNVVIY